MKFVSPGTAGVPDRIIVTPRRTVFVEVKAPGEKPRPLQLAVMRQIEKAGGKCFVVDSVESVNSLVEELATP